MLSSENTSNPILLEKKLKWLDYINFKVFDVLILPWLQNIPRNMHYEENYCTELAFAF